MSSPLAHPMMPELSSDEASALGFVVSLKSYLAADVEPHVKNEAEALAQPGDDTRAVEQKLEQTHTWRNWALLMRAAQEQMWASGGSAVDRQLNELKEKATDQSGGSVATDANFEVPRYLNRIDTHVMPGSYYEECGDGDVRAGALFDLAAAVYHQGRNGGGLNDVRGHTLAAHIFRTVPRRCAAQHSGNGMHGWPFERCVRQLFSRSRIYRD